MKYYDQLIITLVTPNDSLDTKHICLQQSFSFNEYDIQFFKAFNLYEDIFDMKHNIAKKRHKILTTKLYKVNNKLEILYLIKYMLKNKLKNKDILEQERIIKNQYNISFQLIKSIINIYERFPNTIVHCNLVTISMIIK
jgi:hypothetical protein